MNHRKDYTTDERTGILYKRIGDYYFPIGNRFGIADDGDEEIEQMLRAAPNNAGSGAFLGRFAQAHRKYLKESRKSLYASLCASGRLGSCLADLGTTRQRKCTTVCAPRWPCRRASRSSSKPRINWNGSAEWRTSETARTRL